MATPAMPARGERSAPTFDPTNPRTLRRFFEDLEILFARCQINTDDEKKRFIRTYVPIEVSDQWETLPECGAGFTYAQFRDKIKELYPNASESRKWQRREMLDLVEKIYARGIGTSEDWAEFYREYYAITTYLITKDKCSKDEQGRKLLEALRQPLLDNVKLRLQIKVQNHEPDAAYSLKDINEAVLWVLQGGGNYASSAPAPLPAPAASTAPADSTAVKQEDLKSMIEAFSKMADSFARGAMAQQAAVSAPYRPRMTDSSSCHYCGAQGHTIPTCPGVDEDIQKGLCRRNAEGKVVTPSGSWVPRSLPGNNMRERLQAWHQANPNNLAQGSLTYSGNLLLLTTEPVIEAPAQPVLEEELVASQILALEQTLAELKQGRGNGQRDKGKGRSDGAPKPGPSQPASHTSQPDFSAPTASSSQDAQNSQQPQDQPNSHGPSPLHPFDHARDATYIPLADRSYHQVKNGPTGRVRAPIESDKLTDFVFNRLMQRSSLVVTPEELLALSPDLRAKMRASITPKRPDGANAPTRAAMEYLDDEEPVVVPSPEVLEEELKQGRGGAIKLPYDTYANNFSRDQRKAPLRVAAESEALRTLVARVHGRGTVECILDPGCQIVAMSERTANRLGVAYNPQVILNMQSANGQVNRSLGIAENVPFEFHGVTLYMQVHVIREAAYEVLLGRPFDEITKSVVTTLPEGGQSVTIRCPNTHPHP
ncbi:hypothetical protein EIP86_011492 [Pleurotus ostreatoroseus]|nr:hypothetical protein EIP86_011492 [Pleurotus ostreatoroseus]